VRPKAVTSTPATQSKVAELLNAEFGGSFGSPTHWLLLTNGARLSLAVDKFDKTTVTGHHPVFGKCTVPVSDIYVIRTTPPQPTPVMRSLQDWKLVYAPEPVIPESSEGTSSPLVGKEAKPFKLPLLEGGEFELAKEKGKVVILDFWATWCGPCIKSLPGLIEAVGAFPEDKVKLIGVDQSEAADQVKRFVETRGWKLTVALDAGSNVGQQYGVEGIPHTVIVGPDGKIAWVKTGYTPDGDKEASEAIKKLLTPAPAAAAAPSAAP
jgi:thiol-disulfide isomerase/thioredoxin